MTAKIEKSPHTCKRLKEKLINRNKMALPIARDRPGRFNSSMILEISFRIYGTNCFYQENLLSYTHI